jgi:hypothetical protein
VTVKTVIVVSAVMPGTPFLLKTNNQSLGLRPNPPETFSVPDPAVEIFRLRPRGFHQRRLPTGRVFLRKITPATTCARPALARLVARCAML